MATVAKKKTYRINEVFYSLQGEGVRAGTANIFIRFTGCNMRCAVEEGPKSPGGFDCDTEFESGRNMTLDELSNLIGDITQGQFKSVGNGWIILTGGEPALQVDAELCDYFHRKGYLLAIETNGSVELPKVANNPLKAGQWLYANAEGEMYPIDWITVSPKVAEHAIKQKEAHEVKYVRGYGQTIPKTVVNADNRLISPAFNGTVLDKKTLAWCQQLVLENPQWRLSVQMHKAWVVR